LVDAPDVAVGLGVALVHAAAISAAVRMTVRRLPKVAQWWHSPRMPVRCMP
jgi:hypothetical protein